MKACTDLKITLALTHQRGISGWMSIWKKSFSVNCFHLTYMINVRIPSFLLLPGLKDLGAFHIYHQVGAHTWKWQQLAWVSVHITVPEGNLLVYLFLNQIRKLYLSSWRHWTEIIFQYSSWVSNLALHTKLLKTQHFKKLKR